MLTHKILTLIILMVGLPALASKPKSSLVADPSMRSGALESVSCCTPIPWGAELPFPWTTINGNWKALDVKIGRVVSFFLFKVVRQDFTGARQLYVREVNPNTCEVIAEGVGRQAGRTVEVQLSNQTMTYVVKIRSFSQRDYPIKADEGVVTSDGQVLLMSAFDLDHPSSIAHFHLGRLIPDSILTCDFRVK